MPELPSSVTPKPERAYLYHSSGEPFFFERNTGSLVGNHDIATYSDVLARCSVTGNLLVGGD